MTDTSSTSKHSLVLSKNTPAPPFQPLEVHHLSHDLRGPLNSILGFSELLLEGIEGPLNETQIEDIAAIYQSAQNLLLLINNVVDISKLKAGRLSFDFGPVDLEKVLQNVSDFDFDVSKPTQLDLIIEQTNKLLPPVWGDATRVEQMILNLIRFAFRIMRTGTVTITTTGDAQMVQIKVELAEITIQPEDLDNLFELAVTMDPNGRSELSKGGLELPLTQLLAESHQGQVEVERHEPTGTTFYLTLPTYNKVAQSIN